MSLTPSKIFDLLRLKLQFGFASLLATGIDYTVFLVLVNINIQAVTAHYISASIGMLVNFIVQNKYVFLRERALLNVFVLSMAVSIVGIVLGGFLMGWIQKFTFWNSHLYLAKLLVTGSVFFYNFYLKRYAFEKRFI